MRTIPLELLKQQLEAGIPGRRCVEAWLGYGQVLFLGFGDEVIPEPGPEEPHQPAPYQLQTQYADWRVEEGAECRGTADDVREHALAACELLLGRHAVDWHLDD